MTIEANPGLTPEQQNAAGNFLASIVNSLDGTDFRPFRNWVGNNFQSAVSDFNDGWDSAVDFVKGWFKKPSQAPVEYANYEGLSSDPLAGPSTNIPPTFFNGAGALSNLGVQRGDLAQNRGGFGNGLADGFGAGFGSTVDFFKSLGTTQGWKDLGQGVVSSIHLSSQFSPQGMMMRAQMSTSVSDYIDNIPSMSAYEIGHDLGYGSEKLLESALLSKGVGFGANVAKHGVGGAMWKSSTFGPRSYLFGRKNSFMLNGRKGILNRGYFRTGWGCKKGRGDVFRTSLGSPPNNPHIDWIFRN